MSKFSGQYELHNLESLVQGLRSEDAAQVKIAFKNARDVFGFDTNGVSLRHKWSDIQNQAKTIATRVNDLITSSQRGDKIEFTIIYRSICRGNTYLVRSYLEALGFEVPATANKSELIALAYDLLYVSHS